MTAESETSRGDVRGLSPAFKGLRGAVTPGLGKSI